MKTNRNRIIAAVTLVAAAGSVTSAVMLTQDGTEPKKAAVIMEDDPRFDPWTMGNRSGLPTVADRERWAANCVSDFADPADVRTCLTFVLPPSDR